ncbi:MAG TPA: acyl-CoA dehydratase activase, partial [Desulfobacterales bacterium]|nr:acyl-CoA dehydratase activase [Desulfobacterales bacterium]
EGLLHALSQGSPLHGETLVCGGVALNPTVVAWLRSLIGRNGNGCSLHVSQRPEMTAAIGAGLLGRNGVAARARSAARPTPAARGRRAPLALVRSRPARFAPVSVATDDLQNEITVHRLPSGPPGEAPVFLGIDIGSTSTKLAFVDADGELLVDIYRRTQSDPILATRRLFGAALELFDRLGCVPRVAGAGTTGSGRKLVGELVAADVIVNEISAHVTAAVKVDPDVRTIFEIGGQDAKYMRIQAGRIVDANMNYVCAAGTGSFVEELSAKLGYRVEELGADVLGVAPPFINSRCTVFMEQDIHALLQEGVPRREAAGAIIYSVVENYLHRVVGNRPIAGDRIMFQGATARNIALTAAIEQLTGREVVVSPFPHAMGAYGVALLVRNAAADAPSSFRGLELASRHIEIARETCEGCHNRCELIRPVIAGEPRQRLWGMKCGREENGPARKLPTYAVFRKQRDQLSVRQAPAPRRAARGRIVMPLALSAYSLGPFWAEVFDRLGVELVPGPPTGAAIVQLGRKTSGSDFCLPVKVALGHVHRCLERFPADPLFLPHMIADRCVPGLTQTRFCPYLEVLPSLALGSLGDATAAAGRVIAPVMDLRLSDRKNARALADSLRPVVSLGVREVADALGHAHRVRRELLEEVRAAGQARWESVRSQGRPAVFVIGRPYNTLDAHLSQNLPREIAAAGVDVLPMDSLPFRPELLSGYFRNLFWASGQRILSALIQIAQTPGLYPVYLSNFGCGPDSFILSYAERVMGDKPLLILELDEHGSTGGYQTRLEAFLDVVTTDNRNAPRAARAPDREPPAEAPVPKNIRARRLYVP